MSEVEQEVFSIEEAPLLSRGQDLFRLRVLNYISNKDKFHCFYLADMIKHFKVKKGKIYAMVRKLEKEGYLKKIKSYPTFWERAK